MFESPNRAESLTTAPADSQEYPSASASRRWRRVTFVFALKMSGTSEISVPALEPVTGSEVARLFAVDIEDESLVVEPVLSKRVDCVLRDLGEFVG